MLSSRFLWLHPPRPTRYPPRHRAAVFAVALLAGLTAGPVPGAESPRLGTVDFAATGLAGAQPHFQRGVAALHSFWYDEALAAFQRTLEVDPRFAMAWWGIAMAHHRPYLPGSDDSAGRAALAHLGNLSELTRREADYINALRAYYSDQPWAARTVAYASAMQKLYRAYPDDLEAAAFYSVSLLGYGWATDEGFARQEQAAAIASEVYRRNPRHPGAAHYIIHSFDDPALAGRALDAARDYAAIAPDAPHALHMPSHIFLQMGLWAQAARSNEVAWAASEQWVDRRKLGLNRRDYHNYHWWIYACLQQGRYAQAAEMVRAFQSMRPDIDPEARHFLNDALASYVVETRDWSCAESMFSGPAPKLTRAQAASGRPLELCGGGASDTATPTADVGVFLKAYAAAAAGVPEAEDRLAALRKSAPPTDAMPRFWRVRILEVTAVSRARAGDLDGAVGAIGAATALEETAGASPGPPSSAKPPHELAGEILLQAGRPAEALVQFDTALKRHPNRALAVLGRARAQVALPDRAAAAITYAQFLALWKDADAELPELREARRFVGMSRRNVRE